MSCRERKDGGKKADEDFFKRSYIVYFLHKDITPRELKYIDKELERNKNDFKGAIIFIEDEWLLNHPKFSNINFSENYIILYIKKKYGKYSQKF